MIELILDFCQLRVAMEGYSTAVPLGESLHCNIVLWPFVLPADRGALPSDLLRGCPKI